MYLQNRRSSTELRPHAYLGLGSPKQAKMSSGQPARNRTALVERMLFIPKLCARLAEANRANDQPGGVASEDMPAEILVPLPLSKQPSRDPSPRAPEAHMPRQFAPGAELAGQVTQGPQRMEHPQPQPGEHGQRPDEGLLPERRGVSQA